MKNKKTVVVDSGFNDLYASFIKDYVFNCDSEIEFLSHKDYFTKYEFQDKAADLILFTGGVDVNPQVYGQKKGSFTDSPSKTRDDDEINLYNNFSYNIPKLGICRGAQLLCVLNGGKIIQHVENHLHSHSMTYNEFKDNPLYKDVKINVPSDHHQMMYPYTIKPQNFNIIGWSTRYMSDSYMDGDDKQIDIPYNFYEPEIVYFKNTKSLSIQFHPEYTSFPKTYKNKIGKMIYRQLIQNNKK